VKRLLLVEDEPGLVLTLTDRLTAEGYAVTSVGDGNVAVDEALREPYDIVVLDSPPLLRVGDAMTLSARADGLIVLTRLTTARRPMLRELGRIVESAPTTKIGYVVTGARNEGAYSGGYGYGYGKGGYGYAESMYVRGQDGRNGHGEAISNNGGVESAREEETA